MCFEKIMSLPLSEWAQANLPTRFAGCGMKSVTQVADAAYFTSRSATRDLCEAVFPGFHSERSSRFLDESIASLTRQEAWQDGTDDEQAAPSQQDIMRRVYTSVFSQRREEGDPFTRARLTSFSTPGSCRWWQALPSMTLDKHLSNQEITTTVSLQLGVDVIEERGLCRFCGAVLDSKGVHCGSCTAGGYVNLRHNDVRDCLYTYCKRGRQTRIGEGWLVTGRWGVH